MSEDESTTITIRCACGWEVRGPEATVIPATQEHGQRSHNMLPTREEVLAMAVGTSARDVPQA
jgi:hypothetical protein